MFLAGVSPASTLVNGSCPAHGTILEEDFSKHPPTYIVDLEHGSEERYPVRDFPILTQIIGGTLPDQSYKGAGELFIASMISHRFPSAAFSPFTTIDETVLLTWRMILRDMQN